MSDILDIAATAQDRDVADFQGMGLELVTRGASGDDRDRRELAVAKGKLR